MRYISFQISNFRGVSDATVALTPRGAGIFTFIGLNESGKTTALEAISTFQLGKADEKSLYQTKPTDLDPSSFVPKHEKATFTGEITVTATVAFEEGEKAQCIEHAERQSESRIDPDSVPDTFTIKRGWRFENGDNVDRINKWSINLLAKDKGKQKFVSQNSHLHKPWLHFSSRVAIRLPEIVYFPTFLFEQPDRIVLNPNSDERPADKLYRRIIENVGQSLDKPIDLKTNIVDRIVTPEKEGGIFGNLFLLSNNRQQQIDAAINQLSQSLSNTVLDNWSRIFGGPTGNRELRLRLGTDQFDDGTPRVFVQFNIRDGVQPYDISERSLGFRWFFSFLLFTLYRGVKVGGRRTMFLLDEPASNLHAGAQMQLLESFPKITADGNLLLYSTHSHYMINPEWLDQAYIVSNRAVEYGDVSASVANPAHTDVQVEKYRTFVGSHPDKPTYFQPVLDRLQVVPSRLDSLQPSILVEGKGDYLVVRYGIFLCGLAETDYAVLPTRGADHFSELVGILLGWGVNFVLCFDADTKGLKACSDYRDNWAMPENRAFTLKDVSPDLAGKTIEGLLTEADLDLIATHYSLKGKPTKSQIQLFFSEKLALREPVALSTKFRQHITSFDAAARAGLGLPLVKAKKK